MFATSTLTRNLFGAAGAVVIGLGCVAVAATPAAAASTSARVSVSKTVSYADLNLSNAKGRAVLEARIKSAAREICASTDATLAARMDANRCTKAALRSATAS